MDGGSYKEGYKVIPLWMGELLGGLQGHIPMDGGSYKEGYKVISLWIEGSMWVTSFLWMGGAVRRATRSYPYGWKEP